jgi:hypothetical protein
MRLLAKHVDLNYFIFAASSTSTEIIYDENSQIMAMEHE